MSIYDENSNRVIEGYEFVDKNGYTNEYDQYLQLLLTELGFKFDMLGGLTKKTINDGDSGKAQAVRELMLGH